MNNMKCKLIDEVSCVVRHVDLVLARLNQAHYGILRICKGN